MGHNNIPPYYDDGQPTAEYMADCAKESATIRAERKFTRDDKIKIMLLANEYAYWSEVSSYHGTNMDAHSRAEQGRSRAKSELETYLEDLCKEQND